MTRMMDPLVKAAEDFARAAHDGIKHERKYTGEPYTEHLKSVAAMVAEVIDDPEVVAAAWLHDTVEDTETDVEEINDNFGSRVARLVEDLTDVSRPEDGNRRSRKSRDRGHLAHALPAAQTIKLADLIDNAESICSYDKRFGETFLDEMEALMEVLSRADEKLKKRALLTMKECRKKVESSREESSAAAGDSPVMEKAER